METSTNLPTGPSAFGSALKKVEAVKGYVLLGDDGQVVSKSIEGLSGNVNTPEVVSWIVNYFHAMQQYYPDAEMAKMEYPSEDILYRKQRSFTAVILVEKAFGHSDLDDALGDHLTKTTTSDDRGLKHHKSKKGETVFVKISDDTPEEVAPSFEVGNQPSGAAKNADKKSGPPGWLIPVAALLVIGGIGAGVAIAMSGSGGDSAAGSAGSPSGGQVAQVEVSQSDALAAKQAARELEDVARGLNASDFATNDFASGRSKANAAQDLFAEGNFAAAKQHWDDAMERFGEAASAAAKAAQERAVADLKVQDVKQYLATEWQSIDEMVASGAKAAADGDYKDAVTYYEEARDSVGNLKDDIVAEILRLAINAKDEEDLAMAEFYFGELVKIDPKNKAASDFLFMTKMQPGDKIVNAVGMELVYVPPGTFTMGTPDNEPFRDADEIQHEVTLTKGFFIGAHEVTQEQWTKVMGASIKMDDPKPGFLGDKLPVHSISWYQAKQFTERLSNITGETYRLPTEAEWEYAARAGTASAFNTGRNDLSWREANVYSDSGDILENPLAVGSYPEAVNAWGLHDMHGNVWEWTADWSAPYSPDPATDPVGPGENFFSRIDVATKAVRGGSFFDDIAAARSGNRWDYNPSVATNYIGFRVVKEITGF